jgi:hypothetical protein
LSAAAVDLHQVVLLQMVVAVVDPSAQVRVQLLQIELVAAEL